MWNQARLRLVIVSVLVWIAAPPAASEIPTEVTSFRLGVGQSETLRLPGLNRAAVGNSKVARARAVAPGTLLITGMKAGQTTVRAWAEDGKERVVELTVIAPELYRQLSEEGESEESVVRVALEFLEVDFDVSKAFGVQWPEAIQFSSSGTFPASSLSGLNYVVTFGSTQGWIRHLIHNGWARILANPDLYVRLGEEASFHSGGEVPILTAAQTFGGNLQHVEWKPYGLSVKVRPQSGDGLNFRADVQLEISELNRGIAVNGIPGLTKRDLKTKINARDGETVLLSGLVRQVESQQRQGLPLLSDIPLLGSWLFSSRTESEEGNEVLMAVTFRLATRSRVQKELEHFRGHIHRSKGLD